jgi:hypothetical protein
MKRTQLNLAGGGSGSAPRIAGRRWKKTRKWILPKHPRKEHSSAEALVLV